MQRKQARKAATRPCKVQQLVLLLFNVDSQRSVHPELLLQKGCCKSQVARQKHDGAQKNSTM